MRESWGGEKPDDLCYMYGPILAMLPVSLTRALLIGLLLTAAGCSYLRPAPTPILPPDELYSQGENELERKRYIEARDAFRQIVERHPNTSWAFVALATSREGSPGRRGFSMARMEWPEIFSHIWMTSRTL